MTSYVFTTETKKKNLTEEDTNRKDGKEGLKKALRRAILFVFRDYYSDLRAVLCAGCPRLAIIF